MLARASSPSESVVWWMMCSVCVDVQDDIHMDCIAHPKRTGEAVKRRVSSLVLLPCAQHCAESGMIRFCRIGVCVLHENSN